MFFDTIYSFSESYKSIFCAVFGVPANTETGFWMMILTSSAIELIGLAGLLWLKRLRKATI